MKYKTFFRLVLKLIGVYICFQASLTMITYLVSTGMAGLSRSAPSNWRYLVMALVVALIKVSVGLYLFFGGKWIADLAIPANRPYCPECGYDLTGAASNRCPECDTPFRSGDVEPPRDL